MFAFTNEVWNKLSEAQALSWRTAPVFIDKKDEKKNVLTLHISEGLRELLRSCPEIEIQTTP